MTQRESGSRNLEAVITDFERRLFPGLYGKADLQDADEKPQRQPRRSDWAPALPKQEPAPSAQLKQREQEPRRARDAAKLSRAAAKPRKAGSAAAPPRAGTVAGPGHAKSETRRDASSKAQREEKGDGTIGYGRPPEHSRFVKGQSGNPAGRPRKTPNTGDVPAPSAPAATSGEAIDRLFAQTFKATRNGREAELSYHEGLLMRLEQQSRDGGYNATRKLIELGDQLEAKRRAENDQSHEFWRRYIAEDEAARAQGQPALRDRQPWWPDPEDIFFLNDRSVYIRGHYDQATLRLAEEFRDLRDLLVFRDACGMLAMSYKRSRETEGMISTCLGIAMMLDAVLPKRWHFGECWPDERMFRLNCLRRVAFEAAMDAFAKAGYAPGEAKAILDAPLAMMDRHKLASAARADPVRFRSREELDRYLSDGLERAKRRAQRNRRKQSG